MAVPKEPGRCPYAIVPPNSCGGTTEPEVRVRADRADKDKLRKEIDELLRRRPGWSLQAVATPGAQPVWCFGSGGGPDLTVQVKGASICLYLMTSEREVKLGSAGELLAWLEDLIPDPTPSAAIVRPNSSGETTEPQVRLRADPDEIWKEVDELLRHRPGWSLQAIATPGVPPVWCFGSGGGDDLTVEVEGYSICVYLMNSERKVKLGSTSELLAWLQDHTPESLKDPRGGMAGQLKRGHFFKWQ
jgi:hypothetical protein